MDLLKHWRLLERPFEATWDSRFFYGSAHHLEALNRLLYFAKERSMNAFLLSGDIGYGKTLTRAVFARQLDPAEFVTLTVENSGFSFAEIVETLLLRLDPSSVPSLRNTMAGCDHLAKLFQQLHASGRHVVLILDEAQDMSRQTLHELRCLTNYNGAGKSCVSLVLIGQSEIQNMVHAEAALNQRISLRYHLKALQPTESVAYLAHRLRVAGHPTGEIFTYAAAEALYAHSAGIPRELNRLAKLALEQAWLKEHQNVNAQHVEAVISDLENHQTLLAA